MTQIDLLSLLIGIAGTIAVQALLLTIGLLWAASDRNIADRDSMFDLTPQSWRARNVVSQS